MNLLFSGISNWIVDYLGLNSSKVEKNLWGMTDSKYKLKQKLKVENSEHPIFAAQTEIDQNLLRLCCIWIDSKDEEYASVVFQMNEGLIHGITCVSSTDGVEGSIWFKSGISKSWSKVSVPMGANLLQGFATLEDRGIIWKPMTHPIQDLTKLLPELLSLS